MTESHRLRAAILRAIAAGGLLPACATTTSATDAAVAVDTPAVIDVVRADAGAPDVPAVTDVTMVPDVPPAADVVVCPGSAMSRRCLTPAMALQQARFPPGEWTIPDGGRELPDGAVLPNGCVAAPQVPNDCCNPASSLEVVDGQCCYTWCNMGCCGRPLREGGVARVAALREGGAWCDATGEAPCDARTREALARAWRDDALLEHASVAAFARFTLELMALGAPPKLLGDAQRAGLDEVDHARRCFALAARYDGAAMGAGPLDLCGVTLSRDPAAALRAAIEEGCVGETLSALLAAAQRDVATDPPAREALARIAEDEARHAELSWRFVAWMLGERPALRPVAREAFAAATGPGAALPRPPREPTEVDVATWNAHGRLSAAQVDATLARALREVIAPCVAAVVGDAPRATPTEATA